MFAAFRDIIKKSYCSQVKSKKLRRCDFTSKPQIHFDLAKQFRQYLDHGESEFHAFSMPSLFSIRESDGKALSEDRSPVTEGNFWIKKNSRSRIRMWI